jgi:hypothetical protein
LCHVFASRFNTHLCEGVSSADSATAAEEDTELMAPVSCDALSSSDRAVCSWARASSLSCTRLVTSNAKDKFLTPLMLQCRRACIQSHFVTFSRLLKASAKRFTSLLRMPPPLPEPGLFPPALKRSESCHLLFQISPEAAHCSKQMDRAIDPTLQPHEPEIYFVWQELEICLCGLEPPTPIHPHPCTVLSSASLSQLFEAAPGSASPTPVRVSRKVALAW